MSTVISPPPPPENPPFPVHRFTVAEYHRLCDLGLLDEEARVELLEGWIVPQIPHNPIHDSTVHATQKLLSARVSADWEVRVQSAVAAADSEPEPDVAVVRGPASRYRDHHPGTGEIALIVEVAETSLAKDRRKAAIYAGAGVPAYWIINLPQHCIEVFQDLDVAGGSYRDVRVVRPGQTLQVVLDERPAATFGVNEVLA